MKQNNLNSKRLSIWRFFFFWLDSSSSSFSYSNIKVFSLLFHSRDVSVSTCLPVKGFLVSFELCVYLFRLFAFLYIYILCLASIFFLDLFLHPFFYLLFDFSIQFLSKITMVNSVETIEAMEDKARNTYLMFSKTTIENVNNTIILKQYKWKKRSFNLRTAAKILS